MKRALNRLRSKRLHVTVASRLHSMVAPSYFTFLLISTVQGLARPTRQSENTFVVRTLQLLGLLECTQYADRGRESCNSSLQILETIAPCLLLPTDYP